MEWVSVSHKLPPDRKDVLLYGECDDEKDKHSKYIFIGFYDRRRKTFLTDENVNFISHWMELPNRPTNCEPFYGFIGGDESE